MLIKLEQRTYDTPWYADFPRSEYDDRIRRVKQRMAEENVDVLVLWDKCNIRYFTGFHSNHWQPVTLQCAVTVIPVDNDPVIIVPNFFCGVVEGYTYLKDIRLLADPHVTSNIRNVPVLVADTVKSLGHGKGRVGIESGELGGMCVPRPINDIDRFRSELDGATFVEAADIIWKCRVIKSAAEVEALKQATEAVIGAYCELAGKFELGMTEKDVALLIRKSILDRTQDCEPPLCVAPARRIPMFDVPAFDEGISINRGDRLALEPIPTYKGYGGSCGRVFNIGPLTDEQLREAELVDRIQAEAVALVKPGVAAGDILALMKDLFRQEGKDYAPDMAGHGVGLSWQEPPVLAIGEKQVFEEGMVVAVECWTIEMSKMMDKLDVYGGEDYVVVTRDGCDPFPMYPRDQRVLGA